MASLLDSDFVIKCLAGFPAAMARLEILAEDEVAISVVTCMEVYEGSLRVADPSAANTRCERLLGRIDVLPVTLEVARRCASLRHELRRTGARVRARALDLIIAATALHHGLTLVTSNRADYADIPGLLLEQP